MRSKLGRAIGACATLQLLAVPGGGLAQPATAKPVARSAESPELAGLGALRIGTEVHDVALGDRHITVRLWYPAAPRPGAATAVYRHAVVSPTAPAAAVVEYGVAVIGAAPLKGDRYPLVLMSHGYGGWGTHMSRLGEALASRGYVVASIDHDDLPVNDLPSFLASFGSVLVNRAADQRAVLHQLLAGQLATPGVIAETDRDAVGLIGYSMGGYGALTTAGATVDRGAPAFAQLSEAARRLAAMPDPVIAARIKAVVAFAPWGGQPSARVWSDDGLATLTAPLLLVDGTQDDVVDYAQGVQRIFAKTNRADRYLLAFREAAHNIVGNPVALRGGETFSRIEYFNDPVWRQDRMIAIDQHFALAFLDLELKHDTAKVRYLNVPVPASDDGQWPSGFGRQWGGTLAGDAQPNYWRGFQRRWARGLELYRKAAGQ